MAKNGPSPSTKAAAGLPAFQTGASIVAVSSPRRTARWYCSIVWRAWVPSTPHCLRISANPSREGALATLQPCWRALSSRSIAPALGKGAEIQCCFRVSSLDVYFSYLSRATRHGYILEQEKSTTTLLLGQVLVDNLVAGCLVGEPAPARVDKKAVSAFCKNLLTQLHQPGDVSHAHGTAPAAKSPWAQPGPPAEEPQASDHNTYSCRRSCPLPRP